MPYERPPERGDELLSIAQITQRFNVSRTTLHTWRSQGVFPPPEPTVGSTRLRWKESVVSAFFATSPKAQGARTDLRAKQSRGAREDASEDEDGRT